MESHLKDLLDGDDIPSVPQANRLFWGQTLVALLHNLYKQETDVIFCPQSNQLFSHEDIYCSYLSEVTLFNEDCVCKRHRVAALGLIGRKVWHLYV